jgi:NAD(P)-dependent dehydrogenase (short-subunit alcohol dehydrogenase family)
MSTPRMAGTVAVVAVDAPEFARRLAAEGATVVLVGDAAGEAGRLVAELEGGPGRVAVFTGDATADGDALAEFVAELFS